MQIHRIRGMSLRDALERARRVHGAGAVVLTHENAPGGGVTLAVAEHAPEPPRRIGDMQEIQRTPHDSVATRQVGRCLATSGASAEFTNRICRAVESRLDEGIHPIDLAAEEIGRVFPAPPTLPSRGITRVLTFSGMTGVGKTTSLVRLGARLVRAGRKIALATLDAHRVGAVEQLRAYAALLDVPLFKLREGTDLLDYLARSPGLDLVLLDTTGDPGRDNAQITSLAEVCGAPGGPRAELQSFLVLPATLGHGSVAETVASFQSLELTGCLLTKLDETRRPAPVLEHVVDHGPPAAFLSDGAEIGSHLHRPGPELYADLLLRGGLS